MSTVAVLRACTGVRTAGGTHLCGRRTVFMCFGLLLTACVQPQSCVAAKKVAREPVYAPRPQLPPPEPLTLDAQDRQRLDDTVDRALEFLAAHQNSDGSFQTVPIARPAVTALCAMGFLSRGYKPGEGKYHAVIEQAIDYVLEFQDQETGAIVPPPNVPGMWSHAGNYTHGICSTMLADVYPLTGRLKFRREREESPDAKMDLLRHERVGKAVRKSLIYCRRDQGRSKTPNDQGGWRYLRPMSSSDSDLSVTAWMMMFLHSAQKSGFKVADPMVKGGLRFVHRVYSKKEHGFYYVLTGSYRHCTRATVGGGILCLLLLGEPVTPEVRNAADWISQHPFEPYNQYWMPGDRYHYSAFYCSQAMSLLGGSYFRQFYPNLLRVLADHQQSDGSWPPESFPRDTEYGEVYSTALAVLALSPPYQNLQTYQR